MAELGTSRFQQLKVSAAGLGVGNFNLSFFSSLQVSDLDVHHMPLLLLYFSSFQTLRHHQTVETTTCR